MDTTSDLVIVGAGILGLATAFCAAERGLAVTVIDESTRPVGSSIQNFGHACFTGQSDDLQPLAMSSREGWIRAANSSGLWLEHTGTFVAATAETEMQVLREFAEHRGPLQVTLLGRDEAAECLGWRNPDVIGGALLPLDARVNPREAAPTLARHLASRGVRFQWGERALRIAEGTVQTTLHTYRAERVIACPGVGLAGLFPQIAQKHSVVQCTLAMALVERPEHVSPSLSMLTGTSLARYDGFTAMPSSHLLAEDLRERETALVGIRANLMATAIPQGVLIGDSHEYAEDYEPFLDADTSELLLEKATRLLGIEEPRVLQRWRGRYSDALHSTILVEQPDPSTSVAVVTSGVGMTLSFGIAEALLDSTLRTL